jgi:hypothetical protein|tara:strand:+ start:280 stop:408 length:129 start_codon:yes stop_codon:yes gene_type:complete
LAAAAIQAQSIFGADPIEILASQEARNLHGNADYARCPIGIQ